MEKFGIILKQHTPLIHFQHDQYGATLRASEVKPKLDRFILTKLGEKGADLQDAYKSGIVYAESRGWLIGNKKRETSDSIRALDYKMRICNETGPKKTIFSQPPSRKEGSERVENAEQPSYMYNTQYFANNSKIESDATRQGIQYGTIRIEIICLFDDLKKKIEEYLAAFFVSFNFGTRQSKGFGCFLPEEIKDYQIIDFLEKDNNVTGIFKKEVEASPLKEINKIYPLIKRGQNYSYKKNEQEVPVYEKSLLWMSICSPEKNRDKENIKWEKWKIKNHIKLHDDKLFATLNAKGKPPRIEEGNSVPKGKEDPKYVRALLGLTNSFEFACKGNNKIKVTVTDSLKNDDNPEHDKSTKEYAIDRFQSPIRFIVNNKTLFLITYKIPRLLSEWEDEKNNPNVFLPRRFTFTIEAMKSNNFFELEIPRNFNVADFIEYTEIVGRNLKSKQHE